MCTVCNFAFKTKGNLTKHEVSKVSWQTIYNVLNNIIYFQSHLRRLEEEANTCRVGGLITRTATDDTYDGRLVVVDDEEEGENIAGVPSTTTAGGVEGPGKIN
jgi:hypothetical protein